MKSLKNRIAAITIVILFILSMAASSTPASTVKALMVVSTATSAYIGLSANPIGIGQQIEVVAWLTQVDFSGMLTFGPFFTGYVVTITAPDGTVKTEGPLTADAISSTFFAFTPSQVGNYTFQLSFPGQWINGTALFGNMWPAAGSGNVSVYYEPSQSTVETLIVQQAPIALYPTTPLPTSYWNNPVNALNKNWASIMGDWLLPQGPNSAYSGAYTPAGDRYDPYTTSPTTGHIMWTKPIYDGGVEGGSQGQADYYTGESYEPYFQPIIINGMLYYSYPEVPRNGFYALNLRTGATEWYQNYTQGISVGQVYTYESADQLGGLAYLWSMGPTYTLYDAYSGQEILQMVNTDGGMGQSAYGPDGSLLVYDAGSNWISMWNSSNALGANTDAGFFRPGGLGPVVNWQTGITYNVTTPNIPGQGILHIDYPDNVMITESEIFPSTATPTVELSGYNMATGASLWHENLTGALGLVTTYTGMGAMADGVLTMSTISNENWYGFNIYTGAQIWDIQPPANETTAWGVYDMQSDIDPTLGMMFTASYSGDINAYNVTTGALLWTWFGPNAGFNTPYGTYPFGGLAGTIEMTIVDGQLYATTGEHSHVGEPMYPGYFIVDINETTGNTVWSDLGWMQFPAFSDGYMVALNGYDNSIYCYGQGPTKTTVTAPNFGVTTSTPITITGTVTDISAGSQEEAVAANFPNGLPCVSDASMSQFMEAVYEQQAMPNNVTGVQVTLSVIDSNGNYRQIGTTTTDASGTYGFNWTPNIPGQYTLVAQFGGSNSYYGSSAETHFYAGVATTAAPTSSPLSMASTQSYILAGVVAIIVVIIVGFAVLAIVLRKRP